MCRAWQNHWQYYQCTPGPSAMKVTEAVACGRDLHGDAVATMVKPWVRSSTSSMLVTEIVTSSPSLHLNLLEAVMPGACEVM